MTDVGDRCWKRISVTSLRCWWQIGLFMPPSWWHQHLLAPNAASCGAWLLQCWWLKIGENFRISTTTVTNIPNFSSSNFISVKLRSSRRSFEKTFKSLNLRIFYDNDCVDSSCCFYFFVCWRMEHPRSNLFLDHYIDDYWIWRLFSKL